MVAYKNGSVKDALDDLTYQSLTITSGENYAGYTCIVRVYKDRIVLYFNGQNSYTIVPTGVSIFGTISNWTYGVRQVQGVIRDASGANYIFTLFGIDSNGIIYISAPASFPSGLYANCITISDTILL